jgi:DNA-binding CsgD family transcriptional regulator/PAS domain-containing protein
MLTPTSELVAVVSRSPVPALLLQVPSELILAASDAAASAVGAKPSDLVGRNFEEFTTDEPTGAVDLVLTGRLKGFEAERLLRLRDGVQRIRVWVRVLEQPPPIEFVVAVLWRTGSSAKRHLPAPGADEPRAIFGTVSSELLIERISEDVSILGPDANDLVGAPILRLVSVDSAADVLVALAEAASREKGVCISVLVRSVEGEFGAELLVRRLVPSMSFAFSLVCAGDQDPGPFGAEEALRKLGRGLRALDTGEAAAALDRVRPVGADRLSSRESEIVARLVSGDRVPAIAQALFLSQSTIRNHLSSAFGKLGVRSQQELVDLYRAQA